MNIPKNTSSKDRSEMGSVEIDRFFLRCGLMLAIIVSTLFLNNGSTSQTLKPLISPEDYFLQFGDQVVVALSGGINFAYETMVTPEGKIFIQTPTKIEETPFEVIDEVMVSGLNLAQAKELLIESFSKYFKDVEVSITLIEVRTFSVFVGGAVVNPGVYEATPLMRTSQVLDTAQLKGNASRSRIQLLRDGESIVVDIYEFHIGGNPQTNPYLRDRDVIFVPEMEAFVVVKGAVYGTGVHSIRVSELTAEQMRISEGTYELLAGERVSDILRKAGGTAPWADLRNAYLERLRSEAPGKTRINLNLGEILSESGTKANIPLRNGDILVVPSLEEKIYVTGAVNNPGAFDYQSTLSVTDYIGLAGGPTARANLKRVRILCTDGTQIGTPFGTHSPELRQGDTIIVPEVVLKWWQDYVTIVTAVSSVIISWLVIAK